tara:strand:- start:197 stop:334 length:138 start_codon:yes stop_codon:yes gene_type:complete
MAKKGTPSKVRLNEKKRMNGRHSKNKSSNQKNSKLYVKKYRGQGR